MEKERKFRALNQIMFWPNTYLRTLVSKSLPNFFFVMTTIIKKDNTYSAKNVSVNFILSMIDMIFLSVIFPERN